jgi:hypothetical protein
MIYTIYHKNSKILDLKNVECIACNKIISKTNWCKHEKRNSHINSIKNSVMTDLKP